MSNLIVCCEIINDDGLFLEIFVCIEQIILVVLTVCLLSGDVQKENNFISTERSLPY